jgi:hypothetical protein
MVKMVSFTKSPMALSLLFLSSILAVHDSSLFTPAAMLNAPRRGTAIPNSKGTKERLLSIRHQLIISQPMHISMVFG